MKQIIINADDFGINEKVTEEIEKCIDGGMISSTTIMANGECLDEAVQFAKSHPHVSYGIHLCISEFDSITKSPILKKYGLIDSQGVFVRQQVFKIKHFNKELKTAIREELKAQIKIVKSYGISLSHCDSHHHAHTIYGLQRIFADVIKEEGFTKVRILRRIETYNLFRHPILSLKRLYVARFYKKRFKTTNHFSSYSDYIIKTRDVNGICELMCHPGHGKYRAEYEMVLNKTALSDSNVKLITYNEL